MPEPREPVFQQAIQELRALANPAKIPDYKRFFKTGRGEYGEGDEFLGIKVPDIRSVVKKFHPQLSLEDVKKIISSSFHEERMFALLLLVAKYKSKSNRQESKEQIYQFYLHHKKHINNWDLVDVTAPHIIGAYLLNKERDILYQLARSPVLWDRRIAIISTFAFINAQQFEDTLQIADILLQDEHDLIHKAVGWALRNVGIKDLPAELDFLKPRYHIMPRTMLRYAIEKFEEGLRKKYLLGTI